MERRTVSCFFLQSELAADIYCRLLNATPMDPPTPFATLTDHTLPITAIAIGLGTFPRCRILTASLDATCKVRPKLFALWPHADHHASDLGPLNDDALSSLKFRLLLARLARRVGHARTLLLRRLPVPRRPCRCAWHGCHWWKGDEGFAVQEEERRVRARDERGDWWRRTRRGRASGRSELLFRPVRLTSPHSHQDTDAPLSSDTITALHLSAHSPTLLLGTTSSTIHVLSLPALLPTRIIPPPLSSTPPGPITFLSTMLRPPDLGAGTAEGGGVSLPARTVMSGGMGRTVKGADWTQGGTAGRTVSMRVGKSMDVRDLLKPVARKEVELVAGGKKDDGEGVVRVAALEAEVLKLRQQLGKAVGLNEAMWKRVVEGSLKVADEGEMQEVQR